MVKVEFWYDEATTKWDPIVTGANDPIEARQAFAAVVLTTQMLNPALLNFAKSEPAAFHLGGFRIIPAV